MKLALFDFDCTITTKDSYADFLFFAHGTLRTIFGFLITSPVIGAYKLGIIPNWRAKEIVTSYFLKGWTQEQLQKISTKYATEALPRLVKNSALSKLEWHKKEGHKIIVVSASPTVYLKVWCDQQHVEIISTQLEIKDGIVTGKFATKNCYGQEKVNRIKAKHNLEDYDYIYAYGDSAGDKGLFEIANEYEYRSFK